MSKRRQPQAILSSNAPQPIGPYSQAIRCGHYLYCSGQCPIDPVTGKVVEGDIDEQTEQVMKNIKAVLLAAGLDFDAVVKTTIYLVDMADFSRVNAIYGTAFHATLPARSTVAVAALPLNSRIEIEVLAVFQEK